MTMKRTETRLAAKNERSVPMNGNGRPATDSGVKRNGNGDSPDRHQTIGDPLRDSEVRYRRLFESAMDGILILDAKTGRITDANPYLENLLGYAHDELLGKTLWEIGPFHDVAASRESFRQLQAREYVRYDDLPLETRTHECRQVEFVSNVYMVDGVKVVQCNIRDITDRRIVERSILRSNEALRRLVAGLQRSEDVLREQATHDPLTGLFNRRYLDDTLVRELSLSWRRGSCLSLAILDIDHFKRMNDVFGHEAGDLALRGCAHVLSQHLRKSDIACRFGGEEFVIVLPDSSLEDSRRRVTAICALIRQLPLRHRGQILGMITLSGGIACAPEHALTATNLLRAADEALYLAKEGGRNQVVVCESRGGHDDSAPTGNTSTSKEDAPLPKN
jgi:diguanylate cyclase (GGDEF)-like protein/PAS domain S-box-containing protein